MKLPSRDFESRASAIPPHQHVANFTSFRLLFSTKSLTIRSFAPFSQKRLSVFGSSVKTSLYFNFCLSSKVLPFACFFLFPKNGLTFSGALLKLRFSKFFTPRSLYYHISLFFASILPLFFIFAVFFLDYFLKKSYNIFRIIFI